MQNWFKILGYKILGIKQQKSLNEKKVLYETILGIQASLRYLLATKVSEDLARLAEEEEYEECKYLRDKSEKILESLHKDAERMCKLLDNM